MENYRRILAAVDGSKESDKAFKRAISLAKKEEAALIIYHVIDTSAYRKVELENASDVESKEEFAKEVLDDCEKQAKEAQIERITRVLQYGGPKMRIPKEAVEKYQADLIVVGATGMGAVEKFIMGSVSDQIMRRAKCDVLVVRITE